MGLGRGGLGLCDSRPVAVGRADLEMGKFEGLQVAGRSFSASDWPSTMSFVEQRFRARIQG
jgi:hypothetical protein